MVAATANLPGQTGTARARFPLASTAGTRGRVRLRTLSNLRWLAIGGQSAALFIVYFGFGYRLPLLYCVVAIAISALLNTMLALRYPASYRLNSREATIYLAYDVLQLAALLYLTGGLENPFALMFVAPVVIAAATLELTNTLLLGLIAFVSVSTIAIVHMPLPWPAGASLNLPALYQGGIWASLVIGIGFTSIYAWRMAREATRMSAGLAATQLALAREHRLAALGALATAAAHELGTPLGTIAVVARELERVLPSGSPESDDVRLLREQAERCRSILARLANPEEAMLGATARLPLGAFLDDLAGDYRSDELAVEIEIAPANRDEPQPQVWRAPELLHGLGNIIENAADFAGSRVRIEASWDAARLDIVIEDDGPGFAPEIFERIGEPYITSRPGRHSFGDSEPSRSNREGMGLGFFIAKVLLERTGGSVRAVNLQDHGAHVSVTWPRGVIDGETPPGPSDEMA
jgi:two-component system sensor histidine kinase RegB